MDSIIVNENQLKTSFVKGDSITLSYFVRLSSGVSSERAKAVCSSWVCTGSAQVFCTSERLISL